MDFIFGENSKSKNAKNISNEINKLPSLYEDELELFADSYLRVLKNIVQASLSEKERFSYLDYNILGEIYPPEKLYSDDKEVIEYIKRLPITTYENDNYVIDFINRTYDDLSYGRTLMMTVRFLKVRIQDKVTLIDDFTEKISKHYAKAEYQMYNYNNNWSKNVNIYFKMFDGLLSSLRTVTSTLKRDFDISIPSGFSNDTNRPFLEGKNKISLLEFVNFLDEDFKSIYLEYKDKFSEKDGNKIAKQIFPESEFTFISNSVFGIKNPFDVLTKLVVDFVVILDIYFLQIENNHQTFEELLSEKLFLREGFSRSIYFLMKVYKKIGYPMPFELKNVIDRYKNEKSDGTPNLVLQKFIKETAPLIIGKESSNPEVVSAFNKTHSDFTNTQIIYFH